MAARGGVPGRGAEHGRSADVVSPPRRPEGGRAPTLAPRELLRRYRAGASVAALAKELGVSFDWVAQRLIAARTERERLPRARERGRPPELDSDEWLSDELAAGAGVRDLSRRLHVTPSTVRNALRHYVARREERGADPDVGFGGSDPEQRFAAATVRVERATVALERARRAQVSAVNDLHRSGLTVAAVADRLAVDVNAVEALLAHPPSDTP
jgi:hypothetical protein